MTDQEEKEAWRESGRRAFELLQKELEENNSDLKKIATVISEGLEAVKTQYFANLGTVLDERTNPDFRERRQYAALAMQVFGATAPQEHVFPDKEGNPQDITGLSSIELAARLTYLIDKAIKRKAKTDDDTGTEDQ